MKNLRKFTSTVCASLVMFNLVGGTSAIQMAYAAENEAVTEEVVVPVTAEDLIGTWEGTYSGYKGEEVIERNYRIEIDKCTEDGKVEGFAYIKAGEHGEYWFDGTVNYETGEIEFTGVEWYSNPENFGFAEFSGNINVAEENMSGVVDDKEDRTFSLNKISDSYISRRVNLDSIPLRWSGEYDGHDGSGVVVRRNYEIRVQEVAEDGTFNGTALVTPSELADPELGVNGTYYIKGEIDERTGKIDAQGYEWIGEPIENFDFVDLYGYVNPQTYCVEGNTEDGIWLMDPVEFEYYDMCGAWVGYYSVDNGEEAEAVERDIRVDIDKCEKDGKVEGIVTIADGEYGRYIFDGAADFSTGEISFNGVEWLENPAELEFTLFDGKIDTKTLTISGINENDSERPFYLRKITDTFESVRLDMKKLPKYWQGEFVGHYGDTPVIRNIDLLIKSVDENGNYEGEVEISPSDKADPQYDFDGKCKVKGIISERTGDISLQGYEWIGEPEAPKDSTLVHITLSGNINSENYNIDGKSGYGDWHMEAKSTQLSGDVDNDGSITLKDVVLIRRYIVGGWDVTLDEATADVNNDEIVDLKDVVLIRRYIAGGWDVELV